MSVSLGQHPPARQVIVHLSDPHLLAGGAALGGVVDVEARLAQTMRLVEATGLRPAALVWTGDIADLGEPDAYDRVRAIVDPVAERLGTRSVWVMGNHDERAPFRAGLLGGRAGDGPLDEVHDLDGLRLVVLDTTVPGYHHGELDADQLAWLAGVLETPAPRGTILAMHHPPVPSPQPLFDLLELRDQGALERVVRGTDVRAILAGHLHMSSHSTFAGVPVSVAAATCYTMDLAAPPARMNGRDAGQAFDLVHVYEDRLLHQVVPLTDEPSWQTFDEAFLERMAALTPGERVEAFSRKRDG